MPKMAHSDDSKTTRRDFLRVPLFADGNASFEQEFASEIISDLSLSERTSLMMHLSCRAMASQFEIRFPGTDRVLADGQTDDTQLALESLECLESLEEQLSFFRPTSEISRINLLAAEGPVQVESGLFQILCLAKEIWWETEGAWDITSTPLWQTWGFARRAGAVASKDQITEALSRVGFQFVELDDQLKTIHFTKPGIQINLGSIGKGYALDQCAAKLIHGGLKNFLLHGGQSSIYAHGSESHSPLARGHCRATMVDEKGTIPFAVHEYWTIGVPHPWRNNQRIAEIKLRNRAIGTSSSQFQSFRHEGKRYGHIIDPRTGYPAEGVLSATVVAPTSALADALSTAFFVLGPEKTSAYCQIHPEIGAVLLTQTSRGGSPEIHVLGLNDQDIALK
jgi:FAD:protein FMN transferase